MGARPEEIRSEIEETRDRISAEIDELTDRYSPGRVAGRKVHGARDAAAAMRGKVSRGTGWRRLSPRSSGHLGEGHTGDGEAHAAGARYATEHGATEHGGEKHGGEKHRGEKHRGDKRGGDERRPDSTERHRSLLHRRPRGKKAETPTGQSFVLGKTGPPMPGVPGPEDSAPSGKSVYGTSGTGGYPYESEPYPEEGGEPIYRDTERAYGLRDPGRLTQSSAGAARGARERASKRGHRSEIGIAGASVAVGAVGARLMRHPGKREAILLAAADRKRAYWHLDAGE